VLASIWTHFAAGNAIAAVVLGVLFLVTAIFGTVTNDDIAAAGMLQDPNGKGLVPRHSDYDW
jgi:fumarate reductase subunit D